MTLEIIFKLFVLQMRKSRPERLNALPKETQQEFWLPHQGSFLVDVLSLFIPAQYVFLQSCKSGAIPFT